MQFDIRRLDIYRKIPKDLTQPTLTGACVSICSILFILFLFISELRDFITVEVISDMFVTDPKQHEERIPVLLDISIPKTACKYLGLDIQDDLGRHEVGFVENVQKIPLNEALGCRVKAKFQVNKVPGNFHVSTHGSREQPQNPDMSHVVHEVAFGDRVPTQVQLPGSFNPLQNKNRADANALNTHDYFLKVVPTVYRNLAEKDVAHPYQYTYAYREYLKYNHGQRLSPAVWFRYELSPITVQYKEKRKPLYSFLTSVCAIIGGTFTVAGILDSLIFTAAEVFKKAELGKLS